MLSSHSVSAMSLPWLQSTRRTERLRPQATSPTIFVVASNLQMKSPPHNKEHNEMSSISELTPGVWNVDPAHSSIGFVARHLMVTKVRGRFNKFSGTLTIAEDPLQSKVEATADIASVTTGDETRDGHLKSADFFNIEQNPTINLVSTGIEPKGSDYLMHADLTVNGVTKPVDFDLEFEGVSPDPWGGTRAGFSAQADISRKEWGLEYNMVLETGGVMIGDKVKIELDIQAVKA